MPTRKTDSRQVASQTSLLLRLALCCLALLVAAFISGCGSTAATPGPSNPTPGSLNPNQTSVQFGNVQVGASATQVLTFTNPAGSSTITVTSLQVSGTGFSLKQAPAVPFQVAGGQTVSATIQASLTSQGTINGTLTAVSNANPSTVTINLSATGVGGLLSLSPSTFTFNNISLGSSSQPQQGTLTATGGDVALTSDALTGAGFGLSGISFPLTVTSGTSVTFSVNFTPSAAGTTSGTVAFLNGQSALATAQLSGTASGLAISSGSLNFGGVLDGNTSSAQTVTLSAVGGSVTVNSANLAQSGGGGSAFAISGFPTFPFTLSAGQTAQYSVTFAPAANAPGTAAGTLTIASTVNNIAQTLAGTGMSNVLLSWTASTTPNVTYKVYRCAISAAACIQSQPANFSSIANGVAALAFVDGAVSSGQTYYYAMTAVDTNGVESVLSTVTNPASIP